MYFLANGEKGLNLYQEIILVVQEIFLKYYIDVSSL